MKQIIAFAIAISATPAFALTAQRLDPALQKTVLQAYSITRDDADSGGISDINQYKMGRDETIQGALESLLAKAFIKAELPEDEGSYDTYGALVLVCRELGVKGDDRFARTQCARKIMTSGGLIRRSPAFDLLREFREQPVLELRQFIEVKERAARTKYTLEFPAFPNVDSYVTILISNQEMFVIVSDHGA